MEEGWGYSGEGDFGEVEGGRGVMRIPALGLYGIIVRRNHFGGLTLGIGKYVNHLFKMLSK